MNRTLKSSGIFVLAVALFLAAPQVAVGQAAIVGKYKYPDGSWTMEITQNGECYRLKMMDKEGLVNTGVGILDGMVLAIFWEGSDGKRGVYTFRIQEKGNKLAGKAMFAKGDKVFPDEWVRVK